MAEIKTLRTNDRVAAALPLLLEARKLSLRQLARGVGVDVSHLSRVVGGSEAAGASADLALRIARALELPDDYFPEVREQRVIDAVRSDAALRDRIYRRL